VGRFPKSSKYRIVELSSSAGSQIGYPSGATLARCRENILAISAEKYKKEQKKAVRPKSF
jgi:hypothetical protein